MKGRADKWSLDEENLVINQIDVLHREPNQVVIADRTQRAVDHKISKLRKEGRLQCVFYVEWTDEEDGMLLIQIGMQLRNLNQIKIFGRTEQSIYARIKKLRKKGFLIKPVKRIPVYQLRARKRRKKVEKRKKEIRARVNQLKKLLKSECRYWPSSAIALKLSCKQDWVSRWRKRWHLGLSHKEAMQDRVYRENFEAQIAKRAETLRKPARWKEDLKKRRFEVRLVKLGCAKAEREKRLAQKHIEAQNKKEEALRLKKIEIEKKKKLKLKIAKQEKRKVLLQKIKERKAIERKKKADARKQKQLENQRIVLQKKADAQRAREESVRIKKAEAEAKKLLRDQEKKRKEEEKQKKIEIEKQDKEEKEKARRAESEVRAANFSQISVVSKRTQAKNKLDEDLKDWLPVRKPVVSETKGPGTRAENHVRTYEQKLRLGILEEKFRQFCNHNCMDRLFQCTECRSFWYFRKEFFPFVKKDGVSVLGDVCHACTDVMKNKT